MWTLEKWCRWTYLQGDNRDVDIEHVYRHGGGRQRGMNWDLGYTPINTWTFLTECGGILNCRFLLVVFFFQFFCMSLPSPSSLCLLHTTGRWLRETRGWDKEETWIMEPADQGDGRLVPQNSHLVRAWLPGSFMDQRWRLRGLGEVRNKVKRLFNPADFP